MHQKERSLADWRARTWRCWAAEWGRHFGHSRGRRPRLLCGRRNLGRLSDGNGWTLVKHPRVRRTHRGPWQCNLWCKMLSLLKGFGVNCLSGGRTNLQWHLLPRTSEDARNNPRSGGECIPSGTAHRVFESLTRHQPEVRSLP